jgi:hypothetical protein
MKRTRIRPMSDRRRREAKEYAEKRAAFLAQRPTCEKCTRRLSTDVHHKAGRYGGNYLRVETWASLCRQCHDGIHAHPGEARRTGWLI